MLPPESEPDPVPAQPLAVPLFEARRVRRLPLLCMWFSFVCVSLIFILDYDYNPFSGFDSCDQDSVTVFLAELMDLIHVIATWLWFS